MKKNINFNLCLSFLPILSDDENDEVNNICDQYTRKRFYLFEDGENLTEEELNGEITINYVSRKLMLKYKFEHKEELNTQYIKSCVMAFFLWKKQTIYTMSNIHNFITAGLFTSSSFLCLKSFSKGFFDLNEIEMKWSITIGKIKAVLVYDPQISLILEYVTIKNGLFTKYTKTILEDKERVCNSSVDFPFPDNEDTFVFFIEVLSQLSETDLLECFNENVTLTTLKEQYFLFVMKTYLNTDIDLSKTSLTFTTFSDYILISKNTNKDGNTEYYTEVLFDVITQSIKIKEDMSITLLNEFLEHDFNCINYEEILLLGLENAYTLASLEK